MRISKQSLALVAVLAVCGLFLASCGGGSGSGSSSANRNLPPDPGSAATTTLTGVDTNANGVRDEVERNISSNTPKDADFVKTMAVAKALNYMLIAPSPTTRQEALKLQANVICAASVQGDSYGGANQNYLAEQTFDTSDRKNKYNIIGQMLDGGFDAAEAIEVAPCAN